MGYIVQSQDGVSPWIKEYPPIMHEVPEARERSFCKPKGGQKRANWLPGATSQKE